MAVGKVSLDDWAMFTWSLGCTGSFEPSSPPTSWMHRLAMTSLTFMLVWVPDPDCQSASGNSPSSSPAITSSATRSMSPPIHAGRRPASAFTPAAAFFTCPKARYTSMGMGSRPSPMAKCSSDRWVWAPQ